MVDGSYEATRAALAERVKQLRRELGLTQEALALETGVDRTFVSQIERGVGNPSLRTICKIADRLGIHAGALIKV